MILTNNQKIKKVLRRKRDMKERIQRIFSFVEEELDAIVIVNGVDPLLDITFFYVTGYETGLFENSVAFLYPDGSCEVLVSTLEETSASKGSVPYTVFTSRDMYYGLIADRLSGMKRIGINSTGLLYKGAMLLLSKAPDAEFIDCESAISRARGVKDKEEVARIQGACDIASKIAGMIPSLIRDGVREDEVAAEMEYAMKKHGADCPAFTTISSFGKNAAEPHYMAGRDTLKMNQFTLFDFGATYKRYVSDVTRTFFFGKASKLDREMYETVLEAQQIGLDSIEPGESMKTPHMNAAKYIDSTQFKGRFIHSLGHSIGMSVHEDLRFSPIEDGVIEPGMVMTVEPGVYLPGYGGVRIEDDILVTKSGYKMLTSAPKEFMEL
jgi:Xaa-Pro dipeptidase